MNTWYSLNLGDPLLAGDALERVKRLFQADFGDGGTGSQAVFVRHESEGCLHCEVIIYFPPAAKAVAGTLAATPCQKPQIDGLDLLAGSESSWSVLFPDVR